MSILLLLANVLSILVSGPPDTVTRATAPGDSLSRSPASPPDSAARQESVRTNSVWSPEASVSLGFVAVDFAERSNFILDLNNERRTVDQPYPGSDICPRLGLEFALRRKDAFRLVVGGWWQGWSAQSVSHDSSNTLYHRSYSSDLFVASLGTDLLISKSILRLDGGRDARVGARGLVGIGRLAGKTTAWGPAMGFSLLAGAEFADWRTWGVSGSMGLDWLNVQTQKTWADLLWNSPTDSKVSWKAGGLSLILSLRWGASTDTTKVKKSSMTGKAAFTKPVVATLDSTAGAAKSVAPVGQVPTDSVQKK